MTAHETLKPYTFHGVRCDPIGEEEARADCPFCGKAGHLFIALQSRKHPDGRVSEPGMYLCQRCGESGNLCTFLRRLWEVSREATTDTDYRSLSKDRGISPEVLRDAGGMAISILTKEWLFPVFNLEQGFSNLCVYRKLPDSKKPRLMGTPSRKRTLIGMHRLKVSGYSLDNPDDRTVLLVEGQWDWLAMEEILDVVGKREDYHLLGLPGATSFSSGFMPYLCNRHVVLILDNDHDRDIGNGRTINPARQGVERFLSICDSSRIPPASRQVLVWPSGYPDGYDIRDLLVHGVTPPKPARRLILKKSRS